MADPRFRHAGQEQLDPLLMQILQDLGKAYGRPMDVTSGYRNPIYNAKVGGAKKSYHTKGLAADLSMRGMNDAQRAAFVDDLIAKGVGGLITYSNNPDMLHVDLRPRVNGQPVFMHDKSARYMARAPQWFRDKSGIKFDAPVQPEVQVATPAPKPLPSFGDLMASKTQSSSLSAQPDLIGEVIAAAPPKPFVNLGAPTPQNQPPVPGLERTPMAAPAPFMTAQARGLPPVPGLQPTPAAPAMAAADPGSALGGLLSGVMSALSGGAQARAEAQAQADREWGERYAQTLGPSPIELAMQMPTDVARIQPDMPMLPARSRSVPVAPNKDDILASLFGPRPGRTVMG